MRIRVLNNSRAGTALVTVVIVMSASLLVLGATLSWMSSNTSYTHRYNQYTRSLAAAEAATEKAIVHINEDYKNFGAGYVLKYLDKYRTLVPNKGEERAWKDFRFTDSSGNLGRMDIQYTKGTNLVAISDDYKGLLGIPSTYRIIARAQDGRTTMPVKGAVEQQVQVSLIPLYQFAMFYNLDFECTALPFITVKGAVHCNGDMYLTPHTGLAFSNDVTCTKKILRTAKAGNLVFGKGPVYYGGKHDGGVSTLTLPIGTNNSIAAVRQVIEVPPATEDPQSSLGRERLYNKAEMIILVSNTTIYAASGRGSPAGLGTIPLHTDVTNFVRTNITFFNGRENKTVRCTEIDIQKLRAWNDPILNPTNVLRPFLDFGDLRVIYVADFRTQTASTMPGIRLINGETNMPLGLTVATPQPIYIKGHYNCPNPVHRGTTNTTQTVPCSIVADAITLLSPTWTDASSTLSYATRPAATPSTVNAAFVAGIVQTSLATGYSGGVENFPRFLENWTGRISTYNGSMVVMYESKVATNRWNNIGIYYDPPTRNWSFDLNFRDALKLPPATPAASALVRGTWSIASVK